MNNIDLHPNYKKYYEIFVSYLEKDVFFTYGHYDETFCTMRVFETAKKILSEIENTSINKQALLVATIFHDIGKIHLDKEIYHNKDFEMWKKEWRKHIHIGVEDVKKILEEEGHSEAFIEEVVFLVSHHDRTKDNLDERSLELQILQDADLVADCGIVDFIRGCAFSGRDKKPLIPVLQDFFERVDRVDKFGLHLEISKKIAKERMDFYNNILLKELQKELDSELITPP